MSRSALTMDLSGLWEPRRSIRDTSLRGPKSWSDHVPVDEDYRPPQRTTAVGTEATSRSDVGLAVACRSWRLPRRRNSARVYDRPSLLVHGRRCWRRREVPSDGLMLRSPSFCCRRFFFSFCCCCFLLRPVTDTGVSASVRVCVTNILSTYVLFCSSCRNST